MCPQKFVKTLPPGWTTEFAPDGHLGIDFVGIYSTPNGFNIKTKDIHADLLLPIRMYTPDKQIAVKLPDGRLVIPTVHGEKG